MSAAKVLVVDDDASVRRLAKAVLHRNGYNVLEASNGIRALSVLRSKGPIDLVLSDVHMPGISGPQLVKRVNQLFPYTGIVLMSGHAGAQEIDPQLAFISKPFSAGALAEKVREVLARQKQLAAQFDKLVSSSRELIDQNRRLTDELAAELDKAGSLRHRIRQSRSRRSRTQPLGALFRMSRELAPDAAKDFFVESLASFEESHAGFPEANNALHRQIEMLEEQAKRVAHALYDDTGQILACIHFALEKLDRERPLHQDSALQEVRNLLDQMETKLAQLSYELRPTILDDLGLTPAVEFLARWVWTLTGIDIRVEASTAGRLLPSVETVLYRTVQEALNNVCKHAQASHATVRLERQARAIRCSIRDDGIGFDAPTVWDRSSKRGLGLLAARERLHAIGGTLQIHSSPGQGTEVLATVPL